MNSGEAMFREATSLLNEPDFQTPYSGSQLAVSLFGETLLDICAGARHDSLPMTNRTRMTWLCCAKPLIVLALYQVLARHGLTEETPVCELIPEYAANGKGRVTLAHVLTHTVPYRSAGQAWADGGPEDRGERQIFRNTWAGALQALCGESLSDDPGTRVVYLGLGNWLLLAEIMHRLEGHGYEAIARETVADPLGMRSTSVTLSSDEARSTDWAWLVSLDETGRLEPVAYDSAELLGARWPGFNSRGPAGDLLRLLECAAGWRSRELLTDEWRAKLLAPRRAGLADPTFSGTKTLWSLGLCADPVPFGFGPKFQVVGQSGFQSSMVFADLASGAAVAFVSSNLMDGTRDWRRKRRVIRAVYADMGLPTT
jgi:CubicO group peptidase (beta-lactamase class C family)